MRSFLSKPLYVLTVVFLTVWFVLKFVLHKSGYVHAILFTASAFFLVQLVQDRRTRMHNEDRRARAS